CPRMRGRSGGVRAGGGGEGGGGGGGGDGGTGGRGDWKMENRYRFSFSRLPVSPSPRLPVSPSLCTFVSSFHHLIRIVTRFAGTPLTVTITSTLRGPVFANSGGISTLIWSSPPNSLCAPAYNTIALRPPIVMSTDSATPLPSFGFAAGARRIPVPKRTNIFGLPFTITSNGWVWKLTPSIVASAAASPAPLESAVEKEGAGAAVSAVPDEDVSPGG